MPLVETLPVRPDTAQWPVWGTLGRLVVTDPLAVRDARRIVERELAAVDEACSRFRPDSELSRASRVAGPVTVSPLLAGLIAAALEAARRTGGDVDPTVGAALCALGYDRDLAELTARADRHHDIGTSAREPADPDDGRGYGPAGVARGPDRSGTAGVRVHPIVDWRSVRLIGRELTVPAGVVVDLGATAKAWAADRCAALVADACGVGVLVSLGGDIATAGPAPAGGWRIRVQDGAGQPRATVAIPAGAALATSSTISRRWRSAGELVHHILDPRTGRPAPVVWRTASVAANSCVRANALSTATLVRGAAALPWLRGLGAPARLVAASGTVTTTGCWPAEVHPAALPATGDEIDARRTMPAIDPREAR